MSVVTSRTFLATVTDDWETDGRGPERTTQPDASVTVQPSPVSVSPSVRNGPGKVSVARSTDTNTPVEASILPQLVFWSLISAAMSEFWTSFGLFITVFRPMNQPVCSAHK